MEKKNSKTFTTDNVKKIHNFVSVIFGTRVRKNSVVVMVKFIPRRTSLPLTTPNYGQFHTKYIIDNSSQS